MRLRKILKGVAGAGMIIFFFTLGVVWVVYDHIQFQERMENHKRFLRQIEHERNLSVKVDQAREKLQKIYPQEDRAEKEDYKPSERQTEHERNLSVKVDQARDKLKKGNLQEVLAECEAILREDEAFTPAVELCGECLAALGEKEKAWRRFNQAHKQLTIFRDAGEITRDQLWIDRIQTKMNDLR